MASTFSIGRGPDNVFMIRSDVYNWFACIVMDRHPEDEALAHCLEMSCYVQGLAFDDLAQENFELAKRAYNCVLSAAKDVANGQYPFVDADGDELSLSGETCIKAFQILVKLLESWDHESARPTP